jgi:flagellar protein FliO/FliZ
VRSGSEIVLLGCAEHGVTPIRVYSEDEARALGLLDELRGDGDDPSNPMHAAPGSPATVRDLVKTVQRWTVRK